MDIESAGGARADWRSKGPLVVAGALVAYAAAYRPVDAIFGDSAAILFIAPLLAAGALAGARGGVAVALLYLPLNALLVRASGNDLAEWLASPATYLAATAVVVVGAGTGRLSDLRERVRAQAEEIARRSDALRAEAAERESASIAAVNANLKIIRTYESMTEAFFAVDRQWRYVYMNPVARAMQRNVTWAAIQGKVMWDVHPDLVGSRFYREYMRAVDANVPVRFEEYYAGLGRWFEVSAYPSAEGLSVFFQDVTARKKGETSSAILAAVVQASDDAIVSATRDGAIATWNPGAERLFARAERDVIGKPLASVLAGGERAFADLAAAVARGESVRAAPAVGVDARGRTIPLRVTLSAIREGEAGDVLGYSAVIRESAEPVVPVGIAVAKLEA